MISEEDLAQGNAPEESKQRVRQITKAIRYKARKEGGNLFKAFNDYMSSASGVTATDRASVKQSLGLSERYSSWRDEIREIADVPSSEPKKDNEMSKEIKEKKVRNKIVINPAMKEAFDEIGAEVHDVYELTEEDLQDIDEAAPAVAAGIAKGLKIAGGFAARRVAPAALRATGSALGGVAKGAGAAVSGAASLGAAAAKAGSSAPAKKQTSSGSSINTNTTMSGTQKEEAGQGQMDPQQKQQLKNKEQMMKRQQMLSKQRLQMQKQGRLPMGHATEGYAPGDVDQKVGAVTAIPKKDRDAARDRLLAKAKAKREKMKMKEETEDSLRDKRMERGGVDGNVRYDKAPKFTSGPKKKYDGMSALDMVKADIRKKHGKGAIIDTKKK